MASHKFRGVAEIILRGISMAVSFGSIVSASVYMGIFENICDFMVTSGKNNPRNVTVGNCQTFMYKYSIDGINMEGSYTFQPGVAVCAMLALSLVVVIYQFFAMIHFFHNIKPLNIRIRCCKTVCSIFSLIDVILMIIFSICYCAGGISVSLLAGIFWPYAVEFYENVKDEDEVFNVISSYILSSNICSAATAVAAIAFLSMLFCSGIVVYYIVRQMFKRCSGEASYEVLPN